MVKGEAQGMSGGGGCKTRIGGSAAPVLTLSHLNAHMVNRILRENRKTIPKCLSGIKLFKNVTLQILNFIPINKLIKFFPIWCNVKFSLLFCIV